MKTRVVKPSQLRLSDANFDGLLGITHTQKILVVGAADFGASFEVAESLYLLVTGGAS